MAGDNQYRRLRSFQSVVSDFCVSSHSMHSRSDFEEKIEKINDWVEQQKRKSSSNEYKEIENLFKVLTASINATKKFQTGNLMETTKGALDIIAAAAILAGKSYGPTAAAFSSIIGAVLSTNKAKAKSIVENLAECVHNELVNLNKKLQDQKFNELKCRVSDQIAQLQKMSRGEKLDDPNLWNDYAHFLWELSYRFESPLAFKYDENLTKDDDVADFVTALATYCRAYACFMALLIVAKGKFEDLGGSKEALKKADRKISSQTRLATQYLAFLSEERYLSFLGSLPTEGGKLTKILSLSRNVGAKDLVDSVRRSLDLPEMPDLCTVESAAAKVSHQSVKLKLEGHPPARSYFDNRTAVQFINETDFPMKVVSGTVGSFPWSLKFVQDVDPRSSYRKALWKLGSTFSTGGYIIVYGNGEPSSTEKPSGVGLRVIEFSLADPFSGDRQINMQDKSDCEWTNGRDTHDKMKSEKKKSFYWVKDGVHYTAVGEIIPDRLDSRLFGDVTWRFVLQDFDPVKDMENNS